jgi:hypothetical protein
MSDDPRIRLRPGRTFHCLTLAGGILVASLLPAPAQGIAARPPALGMAVPLPDPGMANDAPAGSTPPDAVPRLTPDEPHAPVAVAPAPKHPRLLGGAFPHEDGRLPNQRTGHRHEHVVRDICIGC